MTLSPAQEAGYNGIHFNQVAHSWVRDVRVVNSDSAFYSWGMVFCTLTGLEVASGDRGYDNGHRGIWLERGQDNLIVNFNFTTKMYHDLSVSFYEHSTAFVNGTGKVRPAHCVFVQARQCTAAGRVTRAPVNPACSIDAWRVGRDSLDPLRKA